MAPTRQKPASRASRKEPRAASGKGVVGKAPKGAAQERVTTKRARSPAAPGRVKAQTAARGTARARSSSTRVHDVAGISEALHAVAGRERVTVKELAKRVAVSDHTTLKALRDVLDDLIARSAAVAIRKPDTLAPELWGEAPSKSRVAAARRRAEAVRKQALDDALDGALTRAEVSDRLHITPQAVSKRLANRQLVAVKHGGKPRFPLWQFTDDDVIAGVDMLVDAFPSTVALSSWATSPSPDLDGRTPSEELKTPRGRTRVFELIESISPAAW
jgi:hypothetical protein